MIVNTPPSVSCCLEIGPNRRNIRRQHENMHATDSSSLSFPFQAGRQLNFREEFGAWTTLWRLDQTRGANRKNTPPHTITHCCSKDTGTWNTDRRRSPHRHPQRPQNLDINEKPEKCRYTPKRQTTSVRPLECRIVTLSNNRWRRCCVVGVSRRNYRRYMQKGSQKATKEWWES